MAGQACRGCRRVRAEEDFERDPQGQLRKTCRQCLERGRNRRRIRRQDSMVNCPPIDNRPNEIPQEAIEYPLQLPPTSLPLAYTNNSEQWQPLLCGRMNIVCSHCKALHWVSERIIHRGIHHPQFESCCKHGDVVLPLLTRPPEPLDSLLNNLDPISKAFRRTIRDWNSAFAFTSLSYNMDQRLGVHGAGLRTFQIHGELYHLQGPLIPPGMLEAQYSQMYLYDPAFGMQVRADRLPNLRPEILQQLTNMLHICSPWIALYKTAAERLQEIQDQNTGEDFTIAINPQLQLIVNGEADVRRANLPRADEVAMIIPEEYGERGFRDIILASRDQREENGRPPPRLKRINQNHAAYLPLHYVLMFPKGELGWHWGLELRNPDGKRQKLRLEQRVFYRYRLHIREDEPTTIFRCQRLFQQLVVDAWATCDQNKLLWIQNHQANLRADLYNGLVDILQRDDVAIDLTTVGKKVVLPSSYLGGDRFMQQIFQDSMAIVRHMGRPSLFITFTANPKWEEITLELLPGQVASDRPDLVARVFHMKQRAMLEEIKKDHIFGRCKGDVWTIEYQKRGLPHMHLLVFLETDPTFLTAENVDRIISAELPDETTEQGQQLFGVIRSCMIHTMCAGGNTNAICMNAQNGGVPKCSKKYPRDYQAETIVQENGYPLYRRRDSGKSFEVRGQGTAQDISITIDNRYVVPYNPYLTWKYKAHINVEICGSVKAIKYIHKYIYKGCDQASAIIASERDEIKRYLNGRYIGPTEAIWRLFKFKVHEELPVVMHLAIHLPGEQPVYFPEGIDIEDLQQRIAAARTTLTAFFDYNSTNVSGRQYLYHEFPAHYRYIPKKHWQPRVRDGSSAIGRMYSASPFMGERYYLRLLLTVVRGPTSFENLRTINGTIYQTFKDACLAMGLLEDDGEWIATFAEGCQFATGYALRQLFITVLHQTTLSNPLHIWDTYKYSLCDDLPHILESGRIPVPLNAPEGMQDVQLDYGLFLLECLLQEYGKSLGQFGLPLPQLEWQTRSTINTNILIAQELDYICQEQQELHHTLIDNLNDGQRRCYTTIIDAIHTRQFQNNPPIFFLHGPAGTGKTFLYNCLCAYARAQGLIVLCVASSGIAAQLLPGGRTAHSRFKIPLSTNRNLTCNISKNSALAQLIKQTALIIWDEVPMQHKSCFEAVNRTLNDICDSLPESLFGGIPVILGGDFAQILPVVRHGSKQDTIQACIQKSFLWTSLHVLHLTENMRILNGTENQQFLRFLSSITHNPSLYGQLLLPSYIQKTNTVEALCAAIYPASLLAGASENITAFVGRSILAYRNDTVAEFNDKIISDMTGEVHIFYAMNTVDLNEQAVEAEPLPAEYLQSIELASLPPSILKLKIGVPLILLRNISPKEGLCNGTRVRLLAVGQNCLKVAILGGRWNGEVRLLPRIKLTTNEEDLPFILIRKQFPVRLCFAMTVNKAQGQSFQHVGVDLRSGAFTHGQLYVALSRVTSLNGLIVLLPDTTRPVTPNVVFSEVLL